MIKAYVDSTDPIIMWFRFDLRLYDHPGIESALKTGRTIIPLYIWDETLLTRSLGGASKWWLHRSLHHLNEELERLSSRLIVLRGDAADQLDQVIRRFNAKTVICSYVFDPKTEQFDFALVKDLQAKHIDFERYNATLLTPPNWLRTKEGRPFRVFTPFVKALRDSGALQSHEPQGLSSGHWHKPVKWDRALTIDDLDLNQTQTASGRNWAAGFDRFVPGEGGAGETLRQFIRDDLEGYNSDRDRPDKDATSHLSPHLRFGEISPQRIVFEIDKAAHIDPALRAGAEKFRSELAWREFSYGLLDQQPRLDHVNFRDNFDNFPWRNDNKGFHAWCRGETGYELVDAGMRELWRTGYMHNRVRMICASFLIKHLLIDWRRGEQWFWDCLLDADPANNPASWQWVAGCGADAAPYFRIFNPMAQAEKFDPAGLYRQRYGVDYAASTPDSRTPNQSDLFKLPSRTNSPNSYPQPIVDHAFARERALAAYKNRTS